MGDSEFFAGPDFGETESEETFGDETFGDEAVGDGEGNRIEGGTARAVLDDENFGDEAAGDGEGNRIEGGTARAVLDFTTRSIVDEPDAVVVEVSRDRGSERLSLHVAPADMGRIIGRRGRVAQALRTLVRAAAARDEGDASVDIVD